MSFSLGSNYRHALHGTKSRGERYVYAYDARLKHRDRYLKSNVKCVDGIEKLGGIFSFRILLKIYSHPLKPKPLVNA